MKLLAILIGVLVVVAAFPLLANSAEATGEYNTNWVATSQYADGHVWDYQHFFTNSTDAGAFGVGFMRAVILEVEVPRSLAGDGYSAAVLTRLHVVIEANESPILDSNRSFDYFGDMSASGDGTHWVGWYGEELSHPYELGWYNFTITLMTLSGSNWVVRDVATLSIELAPGPEDEEGFATLQSVKFWRGNIVQFHKTFVPVNAVQKNIVTIDSYLTDISVWIYVDQDKFTTGQVAANWTAVKTTITKDGVAMFSQNKTGNASGNWYWSSDYLEGGGSVYWGVVSYRDLAVGMDYGWWNMTTTIYCYNESAVGWDVMEEQTNVLYHWVEPAPMDEDDVGGFLTFNTLGLIGILGVLFTPLAGWWRYKHGDHSINVMAWLIIGFTLFGGLTWIFLLR
jgi:hypothetical protein